MCIPICRIIATLFLFDLTTHVRVNGKFKASMSQAQPNEMASLTVVVLVLKSTSTPRPTTCTKHHPRDHVTIATRPCWKYASMNVLSAKTRISRIFSAASIVTATRTLVSLTSTICIGMTDFAESTDATIRINNLECTLRKVYHTFGITLLKAYAVKCLLINLKRSNRQKVHMGTMYVIMRRGRWKAPQLWYRCLDDVIQRSPVSVTPPHETETL